MNSNPLLRLFTCVALLSTAALAGCPTSDTSSCTQSSECNAGLACTPEGVCGVVSCDEGCLDDETCYQADEDGNYDSTADGVCTALACGGRGGSGCADDEECIDGACYSGTSDGGCECSDDCSRGQGCVDGECVSPPDECTDDCECAGGQSCVDGVCGGATDECDPACGEGETCVDGACEPEATGCDPACGEGETCVDGACQPSGGGGALCSECTASSQCGADAACIPVGGATVCASACETADNCPVGYACQNYGSRVGNLCVPASGSCEGCTEDGCGGGEVATCGGCGSDADCADGGQCVTLPSGTVCLAPCAGGSACPSTEYTCQVVQTEEVCVPTDGDCSPSTTCEDAPVCSGLTPELDPATCRCVSCLDDSDCGGGQICTSARTCIVAGTPCTSTSDCGATGYCQDGYCVECLTPGNCADGEICVAGACEPCSCPAGQTCATDGSCVEVGNPDDCSSDADCATIAGTLGGDTTLATCDPEQGCFTLGACNASGGGAIPGLPDFGGTVDVFEAPCPTGNCASVLNLAGLGGGSFFINACGCDTDDDCRLGETCTPNLFDLSGTTPNYCSAGGGGGLPFP